ncbi:Uncharacterised protein [Mycobacteroides abscessus subsp. abscessus]|nr:Uncharacterised protein [Mycobacteroides abscessus subsp. abscessus]
MSEYLYDSETPPMVWSVRRSISVPMNIDSSRSESDTYPTISSPSPESVHSRFSRRFGLRAMTAFAADRMVCVER